MKIINIFFIITSLAFCGRLGIGLSGGGQYYPDYDYSSMTLQQLQEFYYGAEFYLSAEALPNVFLEPAVTYLNNPTAHTAVAGCGLGINVKPRFGDLPIVPYFGLKGTMLFYSDIDINDVLRAGNFIAYMENSTPHLLGVGFAGLSLIFGKSLSMDCNYSYYSFAPQYNVEMVWAGITYYINW